MARFADDQVPDDRLIVFPLPAAAPALAPAPPEVRLRLAAGPAEGVLDGGWWPRSRDAEAELADLVLALEVPPGSIVRLGVDLNDWDRVPRRMFVEGRSLKLGWLPNLDHLVTITCAHLGKVTLLVVPPETAVDPALSALEAAAAAHPAG